MSLIEAAKQALQALDMERVMSADSEGNYTIEVTPKRILSAIINLRAAIDAAMKEQL